MIINQVRQGFMDYQIKEMEKEHIRKVVAVHLDSFQGFFLSFLGPAFLRELYSSILEDRFGIYLVALDGDQMVGFVAGTARASGVYSRLLRQRLIRFGLAVIPAILKRPAIIPRLLRRISDPHGQPPPDLNRGRLMSIAVSPEEHGKGIGQALVKAFLKESSLRDISQVDLTTDKDENEDVNLFYQGLGFIIEKAFTTPEGRVMNQYVIDLK